MFGSLYLDEVTLDPKTVVSVLATAALLQLDGLIDKCAEVMNSTINAEVKFKFLNVQVLLFFHEIHLIFHRRPSHTMMQQFSTAQPK